MNFFQGEILAIDKPYRISSFGALAHVRYLLSRKLGRKIKIGHAGTLDPLATGVLILCTGKATKKIESLQYHTKEYVATLCLGATTPSYDLEKDIDATYPTDHITRELVEETLKHFVGTIEQIPPSFSACVTLDFSLPPTLSLMLSLSPSFPFSLSPSLPPFLPPSFSNSLSLSPI